MSSDHISLFPQSTALRKRAEMLKPLQCQLFSFLSFSVVHSRFCIALVLFTRTHTNNRLRNFANWARNGIREPRGHKPHPPSPRTQLLFSCKASVCVLLTHTIQCLVLQVEPKPWNDDTYCASEKPLDKWQYEDDVKLFYSLEFAFMLRPLVG